MAKQDVDQSISSRHARHPCPPLAYTLFQAVAAFLARDYARSRRPKRESYAVKIWGKPAPFLPFCTINSSLHCSGSGDT